MLVESVLWHIVLMKCKRKMRVTANRVFVSDTICHVDGIATRMANKHN